MGADGTLYMMKAADFAERWPGLVPQQCGLKEHTILGIPALTAYSDTSGHDDFEYSIASKWERLEWRRRQMATIEEKGKGAPGERIVRYEGRLRLPPTREVDVLADIAVLEADPEIELSKRCAEAIDWFEKTAESITVWT